MNIMLSNVTNFVSNIMTTVVTPVIGKKTQPFSDEEPFGIENRIFPEEELLEREELNSTLRRPLYPSGNAFLSPERISVKIGEFSREDSYVTPDQNYIERTGIPDRPQQSKRKMLDDSSSQLSLSSDEDEDNLQMMDSLIYPEMYADMDAFALDNKFSVEHSSEEKEEFQPHPNITLFRGNRIQNIEDEDDDDDLFMMTNASLSPITDDEPHPNFTLFRGSSVYEMNDELDSDDEHLIQKYDDYADADREDNSDDSDDNDTQSFVDSVTIPTQRVNRVSFTDEEHSVSSQISEKIEETNVIPYESSDYEEEDADDFSMNYQMFHPTRCMICNNHVLYQNVYENSCCENIFCRDCLMNYSKSHSTRENNKLLCPKCNNFIDRINRY